MGPKSSATGSPVSSSNPLPCGQHPIPKQSIWYPLCKATFRPVVACTGLPKKRSATGSHASSRDPLPCGQHPILSQSILYCRCNAPPFARLLPEPVGPKTKTINGPTRARRVTCKQAQRTHTYMHTHSTTKQQHSTPQKNNTTQRHNDTTQQTQQRRNTLLTKSRETPGFGE